MPNFDDYFTEFYDSETTKQFLQLQNDRDLFDTMVDSDYIFEQTNRVDKLLEILSLNRHLIHNKTVLNIRPKLGILAFAAIREGAKEVIIIDDGNTSNYIEQLISKHNLNTRIRVIKKNIKDQEIELSKVDILLGDWMGSFGINQTHAEEFIYARDKFLKPDGIVR